MGRIYKFKKVKSKKHRYQNIKKKRASPTNKIELKDKIKDSKIRNEQSAFDNAKRNDDRRDERS